MRLDSAVVVGSGPNGLAAAIVLARAGVHVTVFEGAPVLGGGLQSAPLTLPGFAHDVCAAVMPLAVVSPFFHELTPLDWRYPPVAVAHPLLDGSAAVLARSLTETAASLGPDGGRYVRAIAPWIARAHDLWPEVLAPLHRPRHPMLLARFGGRAVQSAFGFARRHFEGAHARALFAGCAAHSFLPLTTLGTAAMGLVLATTAHAPGWPYPAGGAGHVADALVRHAEHLGVELLTRHTVESLDALPHARAYVFDVAPARLAQIAGRHLPRRYRERLRAYRFGPSAFKIDWALSDPIPWRAEACRSAATVHLGGTLEEIAYAEAAITAGRIPEHPFIVVAQPTLVDPSRAPPGRHTAWAYAHVPFRCARDLTTVIEARIEAFAPGFRDTILARNVMLPADIERHDPNDVGGHIAGGAADLRQLFARPVRWVAPYATPNPAIFLCSASTPPGAGVHGMCGYHAARLVLARRFGV